MAIEIKMPQLSDTMDAGKILEWKKKEGEKVSRGDILAEVETDKANLEIEAFHEGTLIQVVVPADQTAKVGETIAVIGEKGEIGTPNPVSQTRTNGGESSFTNGSPPPAHVSEPAPDRAQVPTSYQPQATQLKDERIKASPLARKIAAQRNIDLTALIGSGPAGRILKKDVVSNEGAIDTGSPQNRPKEERSQVNKCSSNVAPSIEISSAAPQDGFLEPLSKMRSTIARRMQESVREAPHFYSTVSIEMGEVLKLRRALKESEEYAGVSVNHFIIKAAAYALTHEPRINCAMKDNQLYIPAHINIGIITALEDGLLIPVIKDADKLTLKDLAFEARAAVERARAGRPNSADLTGGTFSISNMGMFDVENFTAIINPGQGAVLAVSAIHEIPIVKNHQIHIGQQMKTTLSVDHRVIDGIMSANFLKHFKAGLETPALLLI
ncbi:MAG: 2-oxo acid dehydrogenase subunit E2 [Bdellovibrionales bacterium]|nr:2-oxo acid dehydrogenase subunit E2 [Bdellovibrionales bacterium]